MVEGARPGTHGIQPGPGLLHDAELGFADFPLYQSAGAMGAGACGGGALGVLGILGVLVWFGTLWLRLGHVPMPSTAPLAPLPLYPIRRLGGGGLVAGPVPREPTIWVWTAVGPMKGL